MVEVGRAPLRATRFSGVDIVVFDVVAMVAKWTAAEVYSRACGRPGVGGRLPGQCDGCSGQSIVAASIAVVMILFIFVS